MPAAWLWTAPALLQGVLMAIDELWYHRRRGLPRFERIGHPLDTASVLLCIAVACLLPLSIAAVWVYTGLAVLSCALVTKDEAVHAARCAPGEHWLHGVLFVLHPVVLCVVALLWTARDGHPLAAALEAWAGIPAPEPAMAGAFLLVQAVVVAAFGAFQIAYWCRGSDVS
jgi:hypothetical protein